MRIISIILNKFIRYLYVIIISYITQMEMCQTYQDCKCNIEFRCLLYWNNYIMISRQMYIREFVWIQEY